MAGVILKIRSRLPIVYLCQFSQTPVFSEKLVSTQTFSIKICFSKCRCDLENKVKVTSFLCTTDLSLLVRSNSSNWLKKKCAHKLFSIKI